MGVLLAAGHDPGHLFATYSWEQLHLFAQCIMRRDIELLNMIVGPVVGSIGATTPDADIDYKPARAGEKRRKSKARSKLTAEEKEKRLNVALDRSPFVKVRTVKTSTEPPG